MCNLNGQEHEVDRLDSSETIMHSPHSRLLRRAHNRDSLIMCARPTARHLNVYGLPPPPKHAYGARTQLHCVHPPSEKDHPCRLCRFRKVTLCGWIGLDSKPVHWRQLSRAPCSPWRATYFVIGLLSLPFDATLQGSFKHLRWIK